MTFIVMEYVEGTPLSTEIARGPVAIERAVRIATDLADALGYAHDRGVLHRDLKPANVIVTPHGHANPRFAYAVADSSSRNACS